MRAAAAWWAALVCGVACARELDPAACAPRFDVQRDKIIRTEESRDMGARYLSELDVGARAECLRLCCETDSCDVFVFEEKGPGSCYLFNCGPPEDFRCKFTAHGNFSSGVLALSRRLAELQDQERLAHHEQELVNLRSATSSTTSTRVPTAPPRTAAPPPPPPPETTRPPPPPPPPTAAAAAASGSACSRYQFACRHGGECIAVYNACDGVPQCADGSDEAPELGCPPAPRAPAAPDRAPYKPLQESVEGGEGADRWPHRLAQAQPRRYPGGESTGPHIFSHKGGLLTEPDAPQFAPFEPWPRRPWPQSPPDGAESVARWEWGEADPRRAWPVPPQPPQEAGAYLPAARTMPEVPVQYSSRQQTLRDAPKKGFELRADVTPAPRPPPAPAPSPAPAQPHNTRQDKPQVPGGKAAQSEARSETHAHFASDERDEHEGLSERPPAALMLLLIGLALTAAMGALLGCRARAARRRLRRGKSPFAHDADYLVNGMYL